MMYRSPFCLQMLRGLLSTVRRWLASAYSALSDLTLVMGIWLVLESFNRIKAKVSSDGSSAPGPTTPSESE